VPLHFVSPVAAVWNTIAILAWSSHLSKMPVVAVLNPSVASSAKFAEPLAVQDFVPGKKEAFAPLSLHVVSKRFEDPDRLTSTWQVIAVAPKYIFMFLASTVPTVCAIAFYVLVIVFKCLFVDRRP